jgi:hypothetical protein
LNPAFQIQVTGLNLVDTSECNLYLDLAIDHLSLAVLQNGNREFLTLEYFNVDDHDSFTHIRDILYSNEMLRKTYRKVTIAYNFPESVLVPETIYHQDLSNLSLDMVYGDLRTGDCLTEKVTEWELYNTYRVPNALQQLMSQHFPYGAYWHFYSLLLKQWKLNGILEDHIAELIFYPNKMVVALFTGGELKLIQTFEYETAEDVSYYLLNMSKQFGIDCEKVKLKVKGLIDEQSSVFTELLKYFLYVELLDRPASFKYDDVFDEYPRHFFTPLFEMALCV